jgi:hypothetical protein
MCIRQAGADGQKCARAGGRAGRRMGMQARPWWPDEVIEDTPNLDGLTGSLVGRVTVGVVVDGERHVLMAAASKVSKVLAFRVGVRPIVEVEQR